METEWRIARARLRELLQDNSQASHSELAAATGYSVSWVRKWRKRLAQAPAGDEQVLNGQSHRPHHMPRQVCVEVEDQIIGLRVALSEQYHRTVGPRNWASYRQWYNQERPHQGKDLHDQPPASRLAQEALLPRLPETVDPDAWLAFYDKRVYRRHVDSSGTIQLWKYRYYSGLACANQTVLVRLDAPQRQIHIELGKCRLNSIPLKGLYGQAVDFHYFLALMSDEARSAWKDYLWRHSLKSSPKAS